MLYLETIAPGTLQLLRKLQAREELSDTRLVGGTALALQLGHRVSVDLDLFGSWKAGIDFNALFREIGRAEKSSSTPNGNMQFYYVDDIKVDCVMYDMYPWIASSVCENGVCLAAKPDIAAMKINAITNRGSRKDFIDLYFLLNCYSLSELMAFYKAKYPESNEATALRSLVYFVDAEIQPMPQMIMPFDWNKCKERVVSEVHEFVLARTKRSQV